MNKCKPSLEPLPVTQSTETNINSVFDYSNFAVSVNYYVLRPKKKNDS